MEYILGPEAAPDVATLGGKAASLAALAEGALPIPGWFVVQPAACNLTAKGKPPRKPPAPVVREIEIALAELCPDGEPVAVRSSAADEDSTEHSFAGQLESYLFVEHADVPARVGDVWRSGFSERVRSYRREAGLGDIDRAPAVLVQRMIDAEVSGIAFSADPVSGRRGVCVVSAIPGLGTALVSGECDGDTFHVDRGGKVIKRAIVEKRRAHRRDAKSMEGVATVELDDEQATAPALSETQAAEVANLARRAEHHFGQPQDIEWAFESGTLYLLQSRPITSLRTLADPDAALDIWDNSNIAESYGGITTPLTFSFARRAYEEVYREFCRILKVPARTIESNAHVFARMLGLVRGRVYYNLLSWYRVLAMLPGFAVNRRFMEQMMGVKEGLPESLVAELGESSLSARLVDGFNLARTMGGLVLNHFLLPRKIKAFYARLNEALASGAVALVDMRPDELCAYYRQLERRLLKRWDAPLINDFFAMIFYGVLRQLAEKWCNDKAATLQNDLLCGEGGMISAEPARRVRELAALAKTHPALVEALGSGTLVAIRAQISKAPEFERAFEAYLERFGDRCLDELKLESRTLHEEPLTLLSSVGGLAARAPASEAKSMEGEIRAKAEQRVDDALSGSPVKRAVFGWVLGHARTRVRDRENLRFERTRLFGRVRRVFVELGRRFAALGVLGDARDVFWLEVEECMGFVDGTTSSADLAGIAALRRAEFESYENMEAPADRFETRGIVHHGHDYRATGDASEAILEGDLSGIGCCPGIVRGPARVIRDPRGARLNPGDILVAERTDPGWIMLFPSAAGLVVERGSLLSHSAIVAREMGIPAVVSVSGATRALGDGEWVELDGSTGIVRRIREKERGAGEH